MIVTPTSHSTTLAGTIIMRKFSNNYWYEICGNGPLRNPELRGTPAYEAVADKVQWPPDHVINITRRIVSEIGGPFSQIHVRRGDKARDSGRWPNLERDTRGDAILASVAFNDRVPANNSVYIATDERNQAVFSALFLSRRAFTIENFTRSIPELEKLSPYERNMVDHHLRWFAAPGRIETFPHLTCVNKHGSREAPKTCEVSFPYQC